MALDEALLLGLGPAGGQDRCLRLTTWEPAGFSLGWFQQLAQVREAASAHALGVPVVRRQTGGGAIFHGAELTFTLAAPLDDPLYLGPVAESYARVHATLARAFEAFGVRARVRGDHTLGSDVAGSGMCFQVSSALDLVWERADGVLAKGVGSAQRRRGGRVLHHGSIKLGPDPREHGVATLADGRAGTPSAREVGDELVRCAARDWRLDWSPTELADAELEHVLRRAAAFAWRAGDTTRPAP